ncbi:MAG: hypothetical protein CMP20_04595 [Rickettsiales bacterium]|nr:hypothetical protein [Rickettsiales bacterium]
MTTLAFGLIGLDNKALHNANTRMTTQTAPKQTAVNNGQSVIDGSGAGIGTGGDGTEVSAIASTMFRPDIFCKDECYSKSAMHSRHAISSSLSE